MRVIGLLMVKLDVNGGEIHVTLSPPAVSVTWVAAVGGETAPADVLVTKVPEPRPSAP